MLGVVRGIKQGNAAFFYAVAKMPHRDPVGFQFAAIAALKFEPARGIVAEPFSQARARRDVLEPLVQCRLFLADAARPNAVDQNARAVAPRGRLVNTLDVRFRGHRAATG